MKITTCNEENVVVVVARHPSDDVYTRRQMHHAGSGTVNCNRSV